MGINETYLLYHFDGNWALWRTIANEILIPAIETQTTIFTILIKLLPFYKNRQQLLVKTK